MCIKGRASPWVYGLTETKRPVGAKALIINAFAPTGRIVLGGLLPQGDALGYELLGFQPVPEPPAMFYFNN